MPRPWRVGRLVSVGIALSSVALASLVWEVAGVSAALEGLVQLTRPVPHGALRVAALVEALVGLLSAGAVWRGRPARRALLALWTVALLVCATGLVMEGARVTTRVGWLVVALWASTVAVSTAVAARGRPTSGTGSSSG